MVSPITWFASPRVSTGLATGTEAAGVAVAMVRVLCEGKNGVNRTTISKVQDGSGQRRPTMDVGSITGQMAAITGLICTFAAAALLFLAFDGPDG